MFFAWLNNLLLTRHKLTVLKKLLFSLLLVSSISAISQSIQLPGTNVYSQLPAYSKNFADAFSFTSHTASLANAKKFSVGIYSERKFMLQALSTSMAAAILPTTSGNLGLKLTYAGEAFYNQTTLGLAYGRKLGSKVDVGLQFNYFAMKAGGYGTASALVVDAGAIFHFTDFVQAGVNVYNPIGRKLGKLGEEKLPSIYTAGIGYDVSPVFFIGIELQKTAGQPVNMNVGMHYQFADKVFGRAGVSSATSLYYIGFGVQLKNVRIDITSSFHPYLGTSPGLLMLYNSKE